MIKIIEFSSEKKMMSVIVKDRNGHSYLFSKGADESIIPKLLSISKDCE